jgi:hypothetical protein
VALESEQQVGLVIFIPDFQSGDGRAIRSLCAYPAVIGLCTPFTFPSGNMSDSLRLMYLRPRASGCITTGLACRPPGDVDPLVNIEESIPCMAHLSMVLQAV